MSGFMRLLVGLFGPPALYFVGFYASERIFQPHLGGCDDGVSKYVGCPLASLLFSAMALALAGAAIVLTGMAIGSIIGWVQEGFANDAKASAERVVKRERAEAQAGQVSVAKQGGELSKSDPLS